MPRRRSGERAERRLLRGRAGAARRAAPRRGAASAAPPDGAHLPRGDLRRAARGAARGRARAAARRGHRRLRRRVQGDRRPAGGVRRRPRDRHADRRGGVIGGAVGAAIVGMRPVCEMQFADFVSCGFDQLVNVAGKLHYRVGLAAPIVVRLPSGGGFAGGPFHSQNPEAWFMHAPGLKVVAPSSAADAKGLLLAAIADPNPVIFLEHKYLYRRIRGEVPDGRSRRRARADGARRRRPRRDAYGAMVHPRSRRPRRSRKPRSGCSTCARWCRSTSARSSTPSATARRS